MVFNFKTDHLKIPSYLHIFVTKSDEVKRILLYLINVWVKENREEKRFRNAHMKTKTKKGGL